MPRPKSPAAPSKSSSRSAPRPSVASHPSKLTNTLLLLGTTAVILPLLFPPFYCFFLAPFALVPFCICILRRPMRKGYLALYYLLGVAFFLPNLFWIAPVTIGGWLALALFVALYFPLFALALHRLITHLRIPATIAVPLVWTAVEYIRATFVLGGFPWFLLGNCLTPVPLLIQTADLFGVWGLTFLITMLNGFIVDILRLPLRQPAKSGPGRFSPTIRRLTLFVSVAMALVAAYGTFRLHQQTTSPGPIISVIQENIPQDLKDSADTRDEVLIKHLLLTDQILAQQTKPDLIVWPETMVPAPINPEFRIGRPDDFHSIDDLRKLLAANRSALDQASTHDDFFRLYMRRIDDIYKSLTDRADAGGIPLLIGYGADIPKTETQPSIIQNRTLLLFPHSDALPADQVQEYSKVHLVPFGEYIPFKDVPLINKIIKYMTPIDFDYSNTPGPKWTRFRLPLTSTSTTTQPTTQITTTTRFYQFATPICFEDTMPEPARKMSAPQFDHNHKADFLANVSNDGWFHWVELDQHLQAAQIRAVENRIPIARSVNTGNSGFIDSNGRILKLITGANGSSIGAVGTATLQLPLDSRISFFSQIGDLLPIVAGITSTLLVAFTLARPRRGIVDPGKLP